MPTHKKKPTGPTKAQLHSALSEKTGLTKSQISSVFDALEAEIKNALRGPGQINILPGLVKITKVDKAARPARQGRNPFTGEPMTIKAKAATKVVRVKALKSLKDMV